MLPDNAQAPQSLQVELMTIDALFKRIAERGRKIRIQAKENFFPAQNTASTTGQTVNDETKVTKAQGGK